MNVLAKIVKAPEPATSVTQSDEYALDLTLPILIHSILDSNDGTQDSEGGRASLLILLKEHSPVNNGSLIHRIYLVL